MFKNPGHNVDAKWKTAIERALSSWDTIEEWADYISFLSRLQKAIRLKSHKSGPLPLAESIAEHLSRCLEPSLPAGVHQTTIDVYNTIFTTIGPSELHSNLSIWIPGVLPLISHAAFNVKPLVISLVERHFLTAPTVRELCRPLLVACLPSLDDAASESFGDVLNLVEKLRARLGDDVLWWQAISVCVMTSRECRLGFLAYSQRFLPKFRNPLDDESKAVCSPDPTTFLKSITRGLSDENGLVQRGFLDMLDKNMMLDSELYKFAPDELMDTLMFTACLTICRKDMSLNRRLWSWLLGPEPDTADPNHMSRSGYFEAYGATALTRALTLKLSSGNSEEFAQVCQILLGVMDRWELAMSILPKVFRIVLETAQKFSDDKRAVTAVSALFDGVDTSMIWLTCLDLIDEDEYDTLLYILKNFDLTEEQMLSEELPNILVAITSSMEKTYSMMPEMLQATCLILDKVPRSAFALPGLTPLPDTDVIYQLREHYKSSTLSVDSEAERIFDREQLSNYILQNLGQVYIHEVKFGIEPVVAVALQKFLRLLPPLTVPFTALNESLMVIEKPDAETFSLVANTFNQIDKIQWAERLVSYTFGKIVADSHEQIELSRNIWLAHEACGGYIIPSELSREFANPDRPTSAKCRAYTTLWNNLVDRADYADLLSRPTILFLNILSTSKNPVDIESVKFALDEYVCISNRSEKLLKILYESLVECVSDMPVFDSRLKLVLVLVSSGIYEAQRAYVEKIASDVEKLIFEQVDQTAAPESLVYTELELLLLRLRSHLDAKNVKSGTKLLSTALDTFQNKQSSRPLMWFITEILDLLSFEERSTFGNQDSLEYKIFQYLTKCFELVDDPVSFAGLARLLDNFLRKFATSVPQIVAALSATILPRLQISLDDDSTMPKFARSVSPFVGGSRMNSRSASVNHKEIKVPNSNSNSVNLKTSDGADIETFIYLIKSQESLLSSCLGQLFPIEAESLNQDSPIEHTRGTSTAGNLIGNVISGVFSVETPTERTAIQTGKALLLEAVEMTVTMSCHLWEFIEEVKGRQLEFESYSTEIFIMGRLKTRLRKLMSLLFKYRSSVIVELTVMECHSQKSAVNLIHLFSGSRCRQIVSVLVSGLESRLVARDRASEKKTVADAIKVSKFLVAYSSSLEPDVMEEVWPSVLSLFNLVSSKVSHFTPVLLDVLYLASIVARKMNANPFGQLRKVRKDLGDQVLRLVFSCLNELSPSALLGSDTPTIEVTSEHGTSSDQEKDFTLIDVIPHLPVMVNDSERHTNILQRIMSVLVTTPIKAAEKLSELSNMIFVLLSVLVENSPTARYWRASISELIFDPKLLTLSAEQAVLLKPVVARWSETDKERVQEFVGKIANHGSNSVLFSWSGSQSLTNHNIARLIFLILTADDLSLNYRKILNQLAPVWEIRDCAGHVCKLMRAMMLCGEPSQLPALYAFMSFRLQDLLHRFLGATHNPKLSGKEMQDVTEIDLLVETTKTLDFALTLNDEEFLVYEWLFINDSTDVVFSEMVPLERQGDLIDKVVAQRSLGRVDDGFTASDNSKPAITSLPMAKAPNGMRRPLLTASAKLRDLHAFYQAASLTVYEAALSLKGADRVYMREQLLRDLLNG